MALRIREVLLDVWDPIGIKDEPNAQDEYDSYVGPVLSLLSSGATDDQLSDQLLNYVNNDMGLNARSEDMLPSIRALRAIEFPRQ